MKVNDIEVKYTQPCTTARAIYTLLIIQRHPVREFDAKSVSVDNGKTLPQDGITCT